MHFSKKRDHILLSKPSWFNPYAVTTVKRIKSQNSSMNYKKNQIVLVSWKGSLPLFLPPNALFSNIWLTRALQSLAENELQTYMMYDQTGLRISLSNELSSLEDIFCVQTLKSWSVKSFLIPELVATNSANT